ncbi:MAG: DUF169 domain-containing protein [Actinobacteria bacterium]|nr:DUF169 domain-containing protein [Actinomycetota bacterium]MDI6830843.1 DUF169 domain-containing protein [Actinomycetota bacterium]
MKKVWQGELDGVVEALGIRSRPVAVTFTNQELEAGKHKKVWVCNALKQASRGRSFVIDAETSACPGGGWHCGLTPPPQGPAWRGLQWFLTRGEKLTASIVSFHRMQSLAAPPPLGMAERMVMAPVSEAELRPDLVVFLVNAEQACRLVFLDHYWDGIPLRAELTGSLCHSAIAHPLVTGRSNVTFGDWTARRMQKYGPDVIFVSVPYERIHNLVEAVPACSAGTAELEIPKGFRRR